MKRTTNLDNAFSPASVAIAGVGTENAGKWYLDSLLGSGFKGRVYPLSPRHSEISGLKVYPSVKDIPEAPDYVVSCLPAELVPPLIGDCAESRAKVVAVFTAGFSETGREEGRQLEAEVRRLAEAGGVRVIGPNCMGAYCPKSGLSFTADFPKDAGRVALVCQSGGNTIYFVRVASQRGVRFSKVVSYGNACDVDESDLFEYLAEDADTDIVATYIEGVKNGRRFSEALSKLSAKKPVVVLKGGRTPYGARTAASHTASMAGSDRTWDTLLQQAGAIRVYTLEELVDVVVTFLFMPVPEGRGVAMVAGGGGASVMATDACAANGFVLPAIPPKVASQLRGFLDSDTGLILSNPVELNMFPEVSYEIASTMLAHEGVDLMLGNCVFGQHPWPVFDAWYDFFCDVITRVHQEADKPIGVVLESDIATEEKHFLALQRRYCESRIPVYYSMASACRAIDRFLLYHSKGHVTT